jgi:hypothetical protein
VVNVFARELTDDLASLVKQLDEVVGKNEDKKMGGFVVLLSEDPDADDPKLQAFAEKHGIKNLPLTIFDGVAQAGGQGQLCLRQGCSDRGRRPAGGGGYEQDPGVIAQHLLRHYFALRIDPLLDIGKRVLSARIRNTFQRKDRRDDLDDVGAWTSLPGGAVGRRRSVGCLVGFRRARWYVQQLDGHFS